jgi:diguanylate cyclase (GGDEF)-like protein
MPPLLDLLHAPWLFGTIWAICGLVVALVAVAVRQVRRAGMESERRFLGRVEREVGLRTAELEERNEELRILNAQLLEASLTDSLTGLHNRRYFFEQVAKDIAMARRRHHRELARETGRFRLVESTDTDPWAGFDMAFLMVDLDHFKIINDAYGHTAGDHVLVEVRSILLDCCRSSDIVIRWGGDEFLVLARDVDGTPATALAERIRSTIADAVFRLGSGERLRTTCSIGLAHYPFVRAHPGAVSWEQVVQLADSAMYMAKRSRDGWVSFQSTESTLRHEGVVSLAREAPETLIREGRLRIVASADRRTAGASG